MTGKISNVVGHLSEWFHEKSTCNYHSRMKTAMARGSADAQYRICISDMLNHSYDSTYQYWRLKAMILCESMRVPDSSGTRWR